MSVPLREESAEGGGRAPTEDQLRLARVRSAATGESVAQVLSVFLGAGRHGEQEAAAAGGPRSPAGQRPQVPGSDGGERLAPVIPLDRAARRRPRGDV